MGYIPRGRKSQTLMSTQAFKPRAVMQDGWKNVGGYCFLAVNSFLSVALGSMCLLTQSL